MTITIPDFSSLTPIQFVGILMVVAFVDWVTGVYGAWRTGVFSANAVLNVLFTHGVQIILPIGATFAMGVIGNIQAMSIGADGALAIYAAQTIMSAYGNLTVGPTPLSPVPMPDPSPAPAPYEPAPYVPPTGISHP